VESIPLNIMQYIYAFNEMTVSKKMYSNRKIKSLFLLFLVLNSRANASVYSEIGRRLLQVSIDNNIIKQCGASGNQECSPMVWADLEMSIPASMDVGAVSTMNDENIATDGYPLQGPGEFMIQLASAYTIDTIQFYQKMSSVSAWQDGSIYILTSSFVKTTCFTFNDPSNQLLPVGNFHTSACKGRPASWIVFRVTSDQQVILKNIRVSKLTCPANSAQTGNVCACSGGSTMDVTAGSPTQGTCIGGTLAPTTTSIPEATTSTDNTVSVYINACC